MAALADYVSASASDVAPAIAAITQGAARFLEDQEDLRPVRRINARVGVDYIVGSYRARTEVPLRVFVEVFSEAGADSCIAYLVDHRDLGGSGSDAGAAMTDLVQMLVTDLAFYSETDRSRLTEDARKASDLLNSLFLLERITS
jgi:hypothetical protein